MKLTLQFDVDEGDSMLLTNLSERIMRVQEVLQAANQAAKPRNRSLK